MIFTRRGYRWRINERGFLEMEVVEGSGEWFLYGWLDLI